MGCLGALHNRRLPDRLGPQYYQPSLLRLRGLCRLPGCAGMHRSERDGERWPGRAGSPPTSQLAVRIYFPSLDGSPQDAALLSGCRRFPLVIFVHGDCDANPYEQWVDIPAQLARSGYVVAVTNYGKMLANGDAADTMLLHLVYNWIRNLSPYAGSLVPAPSTAVMGHSHGGTLAAQLAGEIPIAAFASLIGESNYASAQPGSIKVPSLFFWVPFDATAVNSTTGEVLLEPPGAAITNATGSWLGVQIRTHAVVFRNGRHADYMQTFTAGKCDQSGPCPWVRSMTADFLTAFLSKYMPPEAAAVTPSYSRIACSFRWEASRLSRSSNSSTLVPI